MPSPEDILCTMYAMMQQHQEVIKHLRLTAASVNVALDTPKPNVYIGERSAVKVEAWLNTIEEYLSCKPNTPEVKKTNFVLTVFCGGGATWCRHLETTVDAIEGINTITTPNLEAVLRLLSAQSLSQRTPSGSLVSRVQNLQQEYSIREYISAFRDVMYDLTDMYDGDAKHQFTNGFEYNSCSEALLQNPRSLTEAYTVAEYFEAVQDLPQGARLFDIVRPDNPAPVPPPTTGTHTHGSGDPVAWTIA